MAEDEVLKVSRDGPVLELRLQRPKAMNSLDSTLMRALREALTTASSDSAVRCVLLSAEGRAFCAGQDLSDPAVAPDPDPQAAPKDLGRVVEQMYAPVCRLLHQMPVPTVAAVQGVAAGAGASLAMNCDIVIAARSASFIQAFCRIGLLPDSGGTWLLPRLVGRARAMGLAMLGDRLPAEQAERIGLIWRCVDDAELDREARALAAQLAAMPTCALVATRRAIDQGMRTDLDEALAHEASEQRRLGNAADYQEGVRAFLAKRTPVYRDR